MNQNQSNRPNQPIDYAALRRVAARQLPTPPEWLAVGKQVKAPKYGQGIAKVIEVLGQRLFICLDSGSSIQISEWTVAIENNDIFPYENERIAPALVVDLPEFGPPIVTSEEISSAIGRINQDDFREKLRAFTRIAESLAHKIAAVEITEPSAGKTEPFPDDLPEPLQKALRASGITHLRSHQIEALAALRQGEDILLSTPTASGKTLAFSPAIIETCIREPQTTALFIFPLNALAGDQFQKLNNIVENLPQNQKIKIGMITGDVPKDERLQLFSGSPPQILCVNPELLHYQLDKIRDRNDWELWRQFLKHLRYVVIDEAHTYLGSFGANFANLMRRLRLAIDQLGGNSARLQHIFATATIGNPIELAQKLSGRTENLRLIDKSGAPIVGRVTLCLTPSAHPNSEACDLVISWLQEGLKGIVFCQSRPSLKSLVNQIQVKLEKQGLEHLKSKVMMFYGSLNASRREEIIEQLRSGEVDIIISTSALEAGIDLPELDCCLLRGYPGSLMSFRQRQGRVGRKTPGLIIFLPVAQNPLDYFYGNNPEFLLQGDVESAVCNPNYSLFLAKHLLCGACESGIPIQKLKQMFGETAGAIADKLMQQRRLYLSESNNLWVKGYPHRDVSLRGSKTNSYQLIDQETGEELEELEEDLAYHEVFPQAIYTRQSPDGSLIWYRSESLDLTHKRAILKRFPDDPKSSTEAEAYTHIELQSKLADPKIIETSIPNGHIRLTLGWGQINDFVEKYILYSNVFEQTCKNYQCRRHHTPVKESTCPECHRATRFAEITKAIEKVKFEKAYTTQFQAPVLRIEINELIQQYLTEKVAEIKKKVAKQYGEEIPYQHEALWKAQPEHIALHSISHQINYAVPLLILSATQEVNSLIVKDPNRKNTLQTIGYWFDATEGGNGVAEAIFDRFPEFALKAKALAEGCDCKYGCSRCLMQHGCPENNEALNKILGIALLDIIRDPMKVEKPVIAPLPLSHDPQHIFLLQVLEETHKSDANPQQVYPLLTANLDKLNDRFAEVLRDWAKTTPLDTNSTLNINNFSNLIQNFPLGTKANNIEIAITGFNIVLTVFTFDSDPKIWAGTQMNLGNAYVERIRGERAENVEQAIAFYRAALEVRTRDRYPENWALTQMNLGVAYNYRIRGERAENVEQAITCYRGALEVRTRDRYPTNWAATQMNLGSAYDERIRGKHAENVEQAIACYRAALEVRTRDRYPENWALTQMNLGNAYKNRIRGERAENVEQAIACYRASLEELTRERYPTDWAFTQINLGRAYNYRIRGERAENVEQAIACYLVALEEFTHDRFPEKHVATLFDLGKLYQDSRQFQEAYDTFKAAIDTVESLRTEIVSGDEAKQKLAEEWNTLYRRMVEVCLELGITTEAIEYIERSKARNLVELLAIRDLKPKGNIPETVLNELNRLRREIAVQQLRVERENQVGEENNNSIKTLQQQLNNLIAQQIQPIDPSFSLTQQVEPIAFTQIQELLPNDTVVLIEWYLTDSAIHAFIVTRQSQHPYVLSSTFENIEALKNWYKGYLQVYTRQKDSWKTFLASRLQGLAEILQLDRLVSLIPPECSQLILVPHRVLHLFPLHALPIGSRTEENFQSQILLDRFKEGVSYAPSCQLLQQAQARHRQEFHRLFAIQNPTEDLNYTDLEVQVIQQHFHSSHVLVKAEAKKSALDVETLHTTSLQNAHCAHFSCHGYFNFASPQESGLILADEILTTGEIFALDLPQCRLVTLSACETGLTDFKSISDEYIGLPSGFLVAGAPSVVSSLWTVSDRSTALLMIRFYQNVRTGLTVAVALREAQIWLRDATTVQLQQWTHQLSMTPTQREALDDWFDEIGSPEKPLQSPYYWAAFCAIGQ